MTPKDSLQLPVSRPLFDKPSNLICPDRNGSRLECGFALCFAELSTVVLEEPSWRKSDGEILYEEGNLLAEAAHHCDVVKDRDNDTGHGTGMRADLMRPPLISSKRRL